MTEKPKPSIVRIIQSDYLALIGILFPVVVLIIYLVVSNLGYFPALGRRAAIQGTASAPILLYVGIAGAVIGLPLAFWRVRTVQQRFAQGETVNGQITDISFYRDRGTVAYTYTHQGKTYSAFNMIMKTGQTKNLRPGTQIAVVVNPANPKEALIRDLYI